MTVAYFDSSAITKFVLDEPESVALRVYADDLTAQWSSVLAVTEVVRAARRLRGELLPEARAVLDRYELLAVDRAVLERAATLDPPALRSIDAIHLASAIEITPIDAFVTYDRALADAARALGFAVEAPGG